jgi:hypothetical protein
MRISSEVVRWIASLSSLISAVSAFKVEAVRHFFAREIQRVVQFLLIDLAAYVE